MKKVFYILILLLIFTPLTVNASSDVAVINDIAYQTLDEAVNASNNGDTIKLLQDIDTTSSTNTNIVFNFADNVIFDLDGHTITTKNMDYIYRGNNLTIQNGNFNCNGSYALFIGDYEDSNNILLKNIKTEGGINVFNSTNVYIDNVTSIGHNYYSLWADEHAEITVKNGKFLSSENTTAILGISKNASYINIENGEFITNGIPLVLKGNYDNPTIYGGTFDTDPSSYIAKNAKVSINGNQYIVGYSNTIIDLPLIDNTDSNMTLNIKNAENTKQILEAALSKTNISKRNTKIEIKKEIVAKNLDQENEILTKLNNQNYKIANLFDISLNIIDSDTNELITSIASLETELEFQIKIPSEIKNQDSNIVRTYYIIRKHNNEVQILDTKLIAEDNLSFKSDAFSIYALAYLDTEKEEIQNPETYDDYQNYIILITISSLSLILSSIYFLKLNKVS